MKQGLWSPLFGIRNPFGRVAGGSVSPLAIYAVLGFDVDLVADFENEVYATAEEVLGPELVTNGTFDTDISGWGLPIVPSVGTQVWNAGRLEIQAANDVAATEISLQAGKVYQISFTFEKHPSDGLFVHTRLASNPNTKSSLDSNIEVISTSGHIFVASADLGRLTFQKTGTNASAFIDNISVKEVLSYTPATTTFSDMFTYAGASLKTMVDSDGVLKWAPHNLVLHSQNFSDAWWSKTNVTVTADATTAPDGTATADRVVAGAITGLPCLQRTTPVAAAGRVKFSIYLKSDTHDWVVIYDNSNLNSGVWFDLVNGVKGTAQADSLSSSITAVGNGWYLCTIEHNSATLTAPYICFTEADNDTSATFAGTEAIFAWGAHLYRSDLGGMVNNPDRGDSYVPTTSAAVYRSRRGHHVWSGSAWVNEGLLLESEARTNLLTYSQDFSNAAWVKTSLSVTANSGTAPDGTTGAALFTASAITGLPRVQHSGSGAITGVGTFSFFIKAGTHNSWIVVYDGGIASGTANLWFNLATGLTGTVSPDNIANSVTDFGNGWYRVSITHSITAASTPAIGLCKSDNSVSDTFAGTETVYVWGAQLELGATPSSYIPTAGATVTRAAESLTIAGAKMPYSATAMSFQIDGRLTYADNGALFENEIIRWRSDDTTEAWRLYFRTDGAYTGGFWGQATANNVALSNWTEDSPGSVSPGILSQFNVAVRTTPTVNNGASSGVAATPVTIADHPDLAAATFRLGFQYMGTIRKFRAWGEDLGDSGLVEATS